VNQRGCGCSTRLLVIVSLVLFALFVVGFIGGEIGNKLFGEGALSFLHSSEPHVYLPGEAIFHLFGFSITNCLLATWLSILVLFGLFFAATHRSKLVPGRLQGGLEMAIEWVQDLVSGAVEEKRARRFFPVVATIFLFVITNAWLSLIPGFGTVGYHTEEGFIPIMRGANTDINFPLTLAIMSFIFVEYWGATHLGFFHWLRRYINIGGFVQGLKQLFTGKIRAGIMGMFNGFINIFTGFLELLSRLISILSFTFRLFGNMTAGEILLMVMIFLVPLVLPLPFYGLEMLVGFVQALIFGGLTLGFAASVSTPHEE
jgi:F-type H+-transporting ATPase subunit a